MEEKKVPKRILQSLMASVSAGVVPRAGAPYIAIGREDEVGAVLGDLASVSEGGASMRFVIGRYGSGKSFLLQLIRGYAAERGFVTADADLSPDRRLCGAKGTGRATFRELISNLATRSCPDGGALSSILTRWLSDVQTAVAASGVAFDSPEFTSEVDRRVFSTVRELESQVGGFDFAVVLSAYYRAVRDGNDEKRSFCERWLRAEFSTRSEAKQQLRVSSIIDDENWYDYIKLYAVFFRKIGYKGFVVLIDECVNLYKISNRISRENNYEKILSMFNDTLQCKAEGLMLIMGGTPQFLEDPRRGLFSYEALRSRLYDGHYATPEYKNLIGPVIRLRPLSQKELYALILRITRLHAQYYGVEVNIKEEQTVMFLESCMSRAGADSMITPREIIRDYISVLNILMQNPDITVDQLLRSGAVTLRHDDAPGDGGDSSAPASPSSSYDRSEYDFKAEDIEI